MNQINVLTLDSAEEVVRDTDLVICATKSVDLSSNRDLTAFMSVGLASTEVILARKLFNQT